MAKYRIVEVTKYGPSYRWEIEKLTWFGWIFYTSTCHSFEYAEHMVQNLLSPKEYPKRKVIKEYG